MPAEGNHALAQAFGTRLRATGEKSGVSQENLATLAGLSRDAIGKLETGRRLPRLDTLLALMSALEVEPSELLKGLEA